MVIHDEDAAAALRARRFAMLKAFMQAGNIVVRRCCFLGRVEKGKGKPTGGGGPVQLRKQQNRMMKRAAFLRRFLRGMQRTAPTTRPDAQKRRIDRISPR
jgi:hypothetical protein